MPTIKKKGNTYQNRRAVSGQKELVRVFAI